MSDAVLQALIAALLTVYLEWSRRRFEAGTRQVKIDLLASNAEQNAVTTAARAAAAAALAAVAVKVEVVHKATNSIKDELVAATDRMARAEGRAEGKAEAEAHHKQGN